MSTKSSLSRMTIDLPTEDHKRLKALAAVLGKSMRELVLDWIHGNLYTKNSPNEKTLQAIEALEKGEGLVEVQSMQKLFDDLGI